MPRARTPRQRDLNGAPRNQAEVQSLAWVAAGRSRRRDRLGDRLSPQPHECSDHGACRPAVATARYSSFIGAVFGAPIGLLAALLGPRRFAMVAFSCARLTCDRRHRRCCSGLAGAGRSVARRLGCNGIRGRHPRHRLERRRRQARVAQRRAADEKSLRAISGRLTLAAVTLAAAVAAIPVGITLESVYRVRSLGGSAEMTLRPLDERCLTRGLFDVQFWSAPPGVTDDELYQLRRFDRLEWLYIGDSFAERPQPDRAWRLAQPKKPLFGQSGDYGRELPPPGKTAMAVELGPGRHASDGGIRLKQLPWAMQLQNLSLNQTPTGDAALKQLPLFRMLSTLQLNGTAVTDDGMVHIARLANLRELQLADTQIGDAGVIHLAKITLLNQLDLSGTQVTDAGLATLEQLRLADKSQATRRQNHRCGRRLSCRLPASARA